MYEEDQSSQSAGASDAVQRMAPHDVTAEQAVLGSMMLSKDAVADIAEVFRGMGAKPFYRPAHAMIYMSAMHLFTQGEPTDAIAVANDLTERGELQRVGGAVYLHTCLSSVPTVVNAGYYARIVRDKYRLRRLIEAGTRAVQMAQAEEGDVDEILNAAHEEMFAAVQGDVQANESLPISALLEPAIDEIEALALRSSQGLSGVPTGYVDLDGLTHGLQPGQMVTIAARPGIGKSTVAIDIARNASIKHGMLSVLFSLEMARNEIVMRILSAEARVALHHMRSGVLGDEEWDRISRRLPDINDAPLYIDDSPNLTMSEIRAKCRRLAQQHPLRIVLIDYMQLMTSGAARRQESRQQEVSELSRNTKLLAKELGVPVVVLSQLNRGPEQRTDKKPMVSDLRESGCLTGTTRLLRSDTNTWITFDELHEIWKNDPDPYITVWSLDDARRMVSSRLTNVFSTGNRITYRMTLANGSSVEATANHRFLTVKGWRTLDKLNPGDSVAVPSRLPAPVARNHETDEWPDELIALLGYTLGCAQFRTDGSVMYGILGMRDTEAVDHLLELAKLLFQTTGTVEQAAKNPRVTFASDSRLVAWLRGAGLHGQWRKDRALPKVVHAFSVQQIDVLLRYLWPCEGFLNPPGQNIRHSRAMYMTRSAALTDDLVRLLLRKGIPSRRYFTVEGNNATVSIIGDKYRKDFATTVRPIGFDSDALIAYLDEKQQRGLPDAFGPSFPAEMWDIVLTQPGARDNRRALVAQVIPTATSGESALRKRALTPAKLADLATVLDSDVLRGFVDDDVQWERINEIEMIGRADVYDATVEDTHNFIADGVVAHNSIEQDSDIVVLVHREDAYDRESPRAGEADLIVAKHRNGPTATVTVAFQGHYSRFVDMQVPS